MAPQLLFSVPLQGKRRRLTFWEPLTERTQKCEYCGEKAQPSLDLTWIKGPETLPLFCCARWRQLWLMLVKQRCLVRGRRDPRPSTPTSPGDKPAAEMEELLCQGREMEDLNKFIMDLPSGLGEESDLRIDEDFSVQLPVAETSAPTSKVLCFRLSCAPGTQCWTLCPVSATEKHLKREEVEEQVSVPFCDHRALQFGMCHHQAEFLSSVHHNGCSHPYRHGNSYPSGLLALIVVVTEENGRVCIVYDDGDGDASSQTIRAVFQSDGRATCYHSNGNIWLTLDRSGGQCLDEVGARVRRWSWSNLSHTSTPLHPVFLSLNKAVGIRVLGREQVFVSFLARGQQAKFSVGTCCTQGDCKTDRTTSGASVIKEELFVLAGRIRIHLAIQHLHQYLTTPSYPRLPMTTQAPRLSIVAQRLMEPLTEYTQKCEYCGEKAEKYLEEEQVSVPFCDHRALQFGLLALIVVVTEENGRVCIVYMMTAMDDASSQTIRAVFQSDGRTCYHSNGNIWLTLDRSGGQCLDEVGARVRRWSWSNLSHTSHPPAPCLPVPQQSRWDPGPGEGASVRLLPGERPTGKVQRGHLLHS
ncbi:hypothetical protein L3Q82_021497, partial [Scortum barcoo]